MRPNGLCGGKRSNGLSMLKGQMAIIITKMPCGLVRLIIIIIYSILILDEIKNVY